MRRQPLCRICRGPVAHGNLYCSEQCGEGKVSHLAVRKALEHRGFTVDPDMINVYLKDGVALTLEHINHVGLGQALIRHDAEVTIHARAGLSWPAP